VQTGITLFRLGDLSRYISHAVIVGFTLGAAVLLVLDQLKNLLGLPARGGGEDHFLVRVALTLAQEPHFWTTMVGLGTIIVVLGLRALSRRLRVPLPELLMAIGVMAAVTWFFRLDERGVAIVGHVPSNLPRPQLPDWSWSMARPLMGSAFAIGILGLLEAIAMAKAIAARTRQKLDINQQCLSEGLANLTGSFFQCFPGSGSLTRSVINVQAGAVSQWSGVFAAVAVALTMVLFAPLAYYIPKAALAGILMVSASRLVDRQQLLYHLRTTRYDAGLVMVTAIAAVVVSVEFCVLIGIFLSFVLFVPRAAKVHMSELIMTPERVIRERAAGDPTCDRIFIYNLEGELFFGSAPDLESHFERIAERIVPGTTRVVVLRLKRVRNPDAVCLDRFRHFVETLKEKDVTLLLCGVRPDVARVLHTSGLEQRIGRERIFLERETALSSTLEAVRRAYDLVGDGICENCPRRGEMSKEVLYYMI
jgi:SulP family sulfate permease